MARVSIGLPVFNGGKFLEEAIESILSQTYGDFELIISDNASTDKTPEICAYYAKKDNHVRYYRNRKNLGAAKNFNRVFRLSSGEYFKWAAADNKIEPEFLERCVEALDANPTAVLAYTRCKQINEYDKSVRIIRRRRNLESSSVPERLRNLFVQVIGMQDPIWGLMRRNILRRTHLIRPFIGSDDCLLVELILKGAFVEVPEHLLFLRTHPDGYHAIKREKDWVKTGRTKMEGVKEAKWFDPDNKETVYFPNWRRLKEYSLLIVNSDAVPGDKIKMLNFICRLAGWRRRSLSVELRRGINYMGGSKPDEKMIA